MGRFHVTAVRVRSHPQITNKKRRRRDINSHNNMKQIWLLVIKNLNKNEVMDLFFNGLEYETVRGEVHIQYDRKKYLMEDLKDAKAMASKKIAYEIGKVKTIPIC